MRSVPLIVSFALACALAPSVHAAVFTNGSFEMGTDPGAGFITVGAGDSTTITGWTVGGGGVDYIGSYWQAAQGGRSLDLSAASAGSISQTFDTVIGQNYTVTFALAGNVDGGIKTVEVLALGGSAANYDFDTAGKSYSNMGWVDRTYNFTATGAQSSLQFRSLTNSAYGPALDNVRVASSAGAVPEPATWAMMIGGFGLVGASMRRQRRTPRLA